MSDQLATTPALVLRNFGRIVSECARNPGSYFRATVLRVAALRLSTCLPAGVIGVLNPAAPLRIAVAIAILSCTTVEPAAAESRETRPVYAIAHRANSIEEVKACLALGANALEVDLNVYGENPTTLCVGHGPLMRSGPARASAPDLKTFLLGLAAAAEGTRLCLVYFDCKPPLAARMAGRDVLHSIRASFATASTTLRKIRFILSVSNREYGGFFPAFGDVAQDEVLMVDQEWEPRDAAEYFGRIGVRRYGVGNGSSFANSLLFSLMPSLRRSLAEACRLRQIPNGPVFVSTFTVNAERTMKQCLSLGVDAIISDRVPPFYCRGPGLRRLVTLIEQEGAALGVHLATPDDNPFEVNVRLQFPPSVSHVQLD